MRDYKTKAQNQKKSKAIIKQMETFLLIPGMEIEAMKEEKRGNIRVAKLFRKWVKKIFSFYRMTKNENSIVD